MYFFKFQKPGNLEFNMLRRGEIFFASVAELNDASECRPRFILNGTSELWTRLADYILTESTLLPEAFEKIEKDEYRELCGLTKSLGTQLKKRAGSRNFGLEHLDSLFRELLEQEFENSAVAFQARLILDATRRVIRRELRSAIEEHHYIASFTTNAKNPTMWGHYGAAERGFVVVYSSSNATVGISSPINLLHGVRELSGDRQGIYEIGRYRHDKLELQRVTYRKKPPVFNAFHRLIPKFNYSEQEDYYDVPLLIGGDAKKTQENQVGLVKFSDWRYEQEIRAFLPVYRELPPDMRVMVSSPENVCGLIFGPKMTKNDKTRAVLCCHLMRESASETEKELTPHFMFFQAQQVIDRFDFRIEPVGVLDGQCFDRQLPIRGLNDLDKETAKHLRDTCDQMNNQNISDITNSNQKK